MAAEMITYTATFENGTTLTKNSRSAKGFKFAALVTFTNGRNSSSFSSSMAGINSFIKEWRNDDLYTIDQIMIAEAAPEEPATEETPEEPAQVEATTPKRNGTEIIGFYDNPRSGRWFVTQDKRYKVRLNSEDDATIVRNGSDFFRVIDGQAFRTVLTSNRPIEAPEMIELVAQARRFATNAS